jgi:hypothetical protein
MPTTQHEKLKGLVATSNAKIKPLGYLTWFSVPDEHIGLAKLRKTLALTGVPPQLAPKDTKAKDVFRRAMREQEGRHRTNGSIIENTVAQVTETSDDLVYQISMLKRDLNERVIDYPKVVRVIFNKVTEELHFNRLDREAPLREVTALQEAIADYYESNSTKVTGARVRGIVRNYLRSEPDETRKVEGLSGENLRGKAGGIYFVPAQHAAELESLANALAELYPNRAYLHAVPLANNETERAIIKRHHLDNTKQELREATGEARGLLTGDRERAVRSDVIANQFARLKQVQRRTAKYQELLKEEDEEIAQMSNVLETQLRKLYTTAS